MEKNLSVHSNMNDLLRLKKSLQFIREVARSYEIGLYDHVGFSCALAISRAEELRGDISHFCPVYSAFGELVVHLKQLYDQQVGGREIVHSIEKIISYFGLDRYELIPKQAPLANQDKS